jgi:hypothetical protein
VGLFLRFPQRGKATVPHGFRHVKLAVGLPNRPVEAAGVADDRLRFAWTRERWLPEPGAAESFALGPEMSGLCRLRGRDALIHLAIALLMVFERRDILVVQHRGHADVGSRHRHDATIFELALRFEIVAQARERFREIAMLAGRPFFLRREEAMLDGLRATRALPSGVRGPVECAALRRLASIRR